jgi:hypothetical protein
MKHLLLLEPPDQPGKVRYQRIGAFSSLSFCVRTMPFWPVTHLWPPERKVPKLPASGPTVSDQNWKVQVYSLQRNTLSKSVSKRSKNHPDPHTLCSRTNRSLDSAHILSYCIARHQFWVPWPLNSFTVSHGCWKWLYMLDKAHITCIMKTSKF